MKKFFMEPELQKIEINLQENIAASGDASEDDDTIHWWSVSGNDKWNCSVSGVQGTSLMMYNVMQYLNPTDPNIKIWHDQWVAQGCIS